MIFDDFEDSDEMGSSTRSHEYTSEVCSEATKSPKYQGEHLIGRILAR